jgi:hypothetical protein
MATPSNVRVGKPESASGGVYAGPLSSTAPTDAGTALVTTSNNFKPLGLCGDDGLKQTIDTDTTDIKAWGGDTVRTVKTSHKVTYTLTLIESSQAVLEEVFGVANVTTAAGKSKVALNSADNPKRSYVFQMLDGTIPIRVYVPNGQITSLDDIEFKDDDAIGYAVEVSAYPDSSGNKAYLFLDNPSS